MPLARRPDRTFRPARALRLGGVALALAAAAGACTADAPTRPEPTGATVTLAETFVLDGAGVVTATVSVEFDNKDGGAVSLRAPALTDLEVTEVAGTVRSDPVGDYATGFPIRQPSGTVAFRLEGAVERFEDVAVVTLPVWSVPDDAGRADPPVPVGVEVTFPAPVPPEALDSYWRGALRPRTSLDGTAVTGRARVTHREESTLVLVVPADLFPDAPVLGGPAAPDIAERQALLLERTADLEADLRAEAERDDLIAAVYWGAVGAEAALPVLVLVPRFLVDRVRRRRAVAGVPTRLADPPADTPPAVVSLLARDGHDIGREAVAATVLDLARRGVVGIEGPTSDRFRLTIEKGGAGEFGGEQPLLEVLREASSGVTHLDGPPLRIERRGPWWRAFRRATLRDAQAETLVRRRLPSGAFIASVMLLAATTFPLWASSPEAAVAGVVIAGVVLMLPFVGGFVLTPAGAKAAAEWNAFGRYVREQGDLESAPAGAHTVWGPYLSYGAALRVATRAIDDLAPRRDG